MTAKRFSGSGSGSESEPALATHSDLADMRDRILKIVETEGNRVNALLAEHDVRYEQRFRAQGEALSAALTAAEKAVAAALAAAEKASAFAQSAADRAVQKAELANDERFRMFGEKIDELTRVVNLSTGAGSGLKAGWGYVLGALVAISTLVNIYLSTRGR